MRWALLLARAAQRMFLVSKLGPPGTATHHRRPNRHRQGS